MTCSVIQSDCMKFLLAQPQGSVDLVLTSPPYCQARTYRENGVDIGIALEVDEWVQWMRRVFHACQWACRGLVACVCAGNTRKFRWNAAPALLIAALAADGFNLRSPPIYHRVGIPGSGGSDWLRSDYEFIVCTSRPGKLPWADLKAVGHPPKYRPGGAPSHRSKDDQRVSGKRYRAPTHANPGNVLKLGSVGKGHMGSDLAHQNEAPFPLWLAEFFVKAFCPPGGTACDPMCGSGTVGHAALKHGRSFIGCDLRQSQVELSIKRLEENLHETD